ncbi:MAG: hypoxanthine phosphoribosyltransferase [Eggerthellaceae bacterium]|jgi:hypoxanthine phosphoribosyltransferase
MFEKRVRSVHPDIERIVFSQDQIHQRVSELGAALSAEYATPESRGAGVELVCVLKGAATFMSDLARAMTIPLEMDYMAVSSYGTGTTSSGVVTFQKDLSSDITGKHVIIAEDVIDTGLTLQRLLQVLAARNPASLEVVPLLRKDVPGQADIDCKMVGFECPNDFIVGYGLDYAERYRNLPYIGVLKPEAYQ